MDKHLCPDQIPVQFNMIKPWLNGHLAFPDNDKLSGPKLQFSLHSADTYCKMYKEVVKNKNTIVYEYLISWSPLFVLGATTRASHLLNTSWPPLFVLGATIRGVLQGLTNCVSGHPGQP